MDFAALVWPPCRAFRCNIWNKLHSLGVKQKYVAREWDMYEWYVGENRVHTQNSVSGAEGAPVDCRSVSSAS